jgi:hypothetical protein
LGLNERLLTAGLLRTLGEQVREGAKAKQRQKDAGQHNEETN